MENDVSLASVKGVELTGSGCAVFIGPEDKTFIIYVDQFLGNAILMALKSEMNERPFTHDLIGSILLGLGVSLERVIINDVSNDTFFARIILKMENELGSKVMELDARPSDSIVLALQAKKPIYVSQRVLDTTIDVTETLKKIRKKEN